ncbi:hypothetical protein BDR04DRAFT_1156536 [Suillus decipiens]|nr:hypothetical protein BDR04DRAFT_1156536 [Suillus decipiens]
MNPGTFKAQVLLKDDGMTTVDKPPHHKLFNSHASAISPVLQWWLNNQNTKLSSSSAPVFNFTIRNEVVNFFHPQVPAIPTMPLAAAPAPSDLTCTSLLHPSHMQGMDMPLNKFCAKYDLGNTIHAKFAENAYKEAQFLHFVTIPELKEMGFQLGEIAALCDAVER